MGYTDAPAGWWREFVLADPPRTAKLAVVRSDGSPHVAPVWVDLDGEDVVFMTSSETVKGKAILRDPRVALCWDDEQPPFSFVLARGSATTSVAEHDLWSGRVESEGGTWARIAPRSTGAGTRCTPRWS